jgi:hypothetical protein
MQVSTVAGSGGIPSSDHVLPRHLDHEMSYLPGPSRVQQPGLDPHAAWKAIAFAGSGDSGVEDSDSFDETSGDEVDGPDPSIAVQAARTPRLDYTQFAAIFEDDASTQDDEVRGPWRSGSNRVCCFRIPPCKPGADPSKDEASPRNSDSSLDRPSSVANASTTGTVLYNHARAVPPRMIGVSDLYISARNTMLQSKEPSKTLSSQHAAKEPISKAAEFYRPQPTVNAVTSHRDLIPRIGEYETMPRGHP